MVTRSGASWGGPGHGGAMAGGEEQSAPVKRAARVRERARGGGGMEEELTADPIEATARPGRGLELANPRKFAGGRRLGTSLRATLQGFRRAMDR